MTHRFMEETSKFSEVVTVLALLIYPELKLPQAKIKIRRHIQTERDNQVLSTIKIEGESFINTASLFNWALKRWPFLCLHIELTPSALEATNSIHIPNLNVEGFIASRSSDQAEADKEDTERQEEHHHTKKLLEDAEEKLKTYQQRDEKKRQDGHIHGKNSWSTSKT